MIKSNLVLVPYLYSLDSTEVKWNDVVRSEESKGWELRSVTPVPAVDDEPSAVILHFVDNVR